jgi:hypothetical protein
VHENDMHIRPLMRLLAACHCNAPIRLLLLVGCCRRRRPHHHMRLPPLPDMGGASRL